MPGKKVVWIFRKKTPLFFSIEKVFNTLLPFVTRFDVIIAEAISRKVSPSAIRENLSFFKKLRADIYHVTGDIHYAALVLPGRKTVLTIHDSVFLTTQTGLKKIVLKLFWLTLPVKRVAWITTISEQSKKEILAHTRCSPDKIIVIPDPVNPSFQYSAKAWPVADVPVFLLVGTKSNKNLERIAEALSGFKCRLDIVGRLTEAQTAVLNHNKIRYTNQFDLDDDALLERYLASDALIFPSLYEGFGLPVIEAQALGRPAITSNIEPMKSVAGDAACLVDPLDVQSIRAGAEAILNSPSYRNELIQKGLENVKRFLPAAIAEAYSAVYDRISAD
jgi:glycosyltransferase involved in cell wall biosynthesis